eukprot:83755_1
MMSSKALVVASSILFAIGVDTQTNPCCGIWAECWCCYEVCGDASDAGTQKQSFDISSDQSKDNETNLLLMIICGLLAVLIVFQLMKFVWWMYNNCCAQNNYKNEKMYSFGSESGNDEQKANEEQQEIEP